MGIAEENATDATAPEALVAAKAQLRGELQRRRAALDPAGIDAASRRACARAAELACFRAARAVALYRALPRELQPEGLLERCRAEGRRVALPAWDGAAGRYRFAWWEPGAALARGPMRIEEPAAPAWAGPRELDLIVVPGLGFDRGGGRIGHGAGHYDRLLAAYAGARLGLAFEGQLVGQVPAGPRDARMDAVATEAAVYAARRDGPA